MATVVSPPMTVPDTSVVLRHVSWETYERLLADDEGRHVPRITYDRGEMELVSPSLRHDKDAQTLILLVSIVAATLDIPIVSVGHTTFRRKDLQRGFEPDAGFYVQNEERMYDRDELDTSVDPPYDVVLEMEYSPSALNKLALFAAMGVPEVWCGQRGGVVILHREGDGYRESSASLAIPPLTVEVLTRFLAESRALRSPEWVQAVGDWARLQRTLGHG